MYRPLTDNPDEVAFYKSYFSTGIDNCSTFRLYNNPFDIDIYVITFNNTFMVEYQIETLRKFMKAPFNIFIVDNNNWLYPEQSNEILELCVEKEISYIKAPDNHYQRKEFFDPSMKLGTTMSWIYKQCVHPRRPKYFGYLDHDCFLVKHFDIRPYLDANKMYGKVIHSKISDAWNLHVVVNFYKFDFVESLDLDFRASHQHQLDTGAANYEILYRNCDWHMYDIESHSFRFDKEDVNRKGSVQHYETIDNGKFFHMCASSHDQLVGDGKFKLAYTKGFLDARLEQ